MNLHQRRTHFFQLLLIGAAALPLLLSPTVASAVPLLWTLDNAVLGNGQEATGSFVFDPVAVTYSNIMVSLSGNDYDTLVAGDAGFGEFAQSGDLPGLNGDGLLSLKFANPLTNAGGTIDLELGFPNGSGNIGCLDDDCFLRAISQDTTFASGSVVGVVVPEPTAISLLLAALGSLWLCRRVL